MLMVNNIKVEYFLPWPNLDNDRTASTEITKWWQWDFKDVLMEKDVLMAFFMAVKSIQQSVPKAPEMCSLCATKAL